MTLTPCDLAFAWMAAPEPESRFVSRRTLAPLVMACSACCCWVDLSPCGVVDRRVDAGGLERLLAGTAGPPLSQRTDDFVSGSRTATLPAFAVLELVDAAVVVVTAAGGDAETQRGGGREGRDAERLLCACCSS